MKKEQFDKLKVQLRETRELIKEVEFMKGVDSLEKLRHVLQTVTYWADTWAIGVLEKELNMKVVLFSEESFEDGAYGNVLLCGQLNEDIPSFSPDFYILSCYTGNHYKLISYKHKFIFGFEEIPYGVKILIVNKCLERNAGAYYVIPEFRELKRQLGIDADEGAPLAAVISISSSSSDSSDSSASSATESPETETEKYIQKTLDLDPGVVFQFHEKADLKKLPGKGSGEMFPTVGNKKSETIHTDYTMLSSMPQWRRKLDDSWMGVAKSPESGEEKLGGGEETQKETGVFQTPDGHRWASVEHYFHASKFRKMNPDFYAQFALDGGVGGKGGEFSRNLKLARLAGEPFGTLEKTSVKKSEKDLATSAEELDERYQVVMDKKKVSGGGAAKEYKRDVRIKIDPDFFGGRHLDERKLALRAKFTQNMDLGVLLKETKRAVLRQYHLGREPVTDYSLMRVRDELIHSVSGV
jgi:hypothetical protein